MTFYNGLLYEGTGLNGKSEIRKLDKDDPSQVLESKKLSEEYFGEGITYYQNRDGRDCMIQLTWKSRKGFIYAADSLELLREFEYETTTGEGMYISYSSFLVLYLYCRTQLFVKTKNYLYN